MSERPEVDELPEAPQRTQPQSNFSKVADAFFAALSTFRRQLVDLADWVKSRAEDFDGSVQEAESARDVAKEHRDDAEQYRDMAAEWATKSENNEVESGQYSAYHHAQKAEQYKESAKAVSDAFLAEVKDSGDLPSLEDNASRFLAVTEGGTAVEWRLLPSVRQPEIISPKDGADGIAVGVTVKGFQFAPLHSADERDYRRLVVVEQGGDWSDPYKEIAVDSDDPVVPLDPDQSFDMRIQDVLKDGTESPWSDIVSITTADVYVESPEILSPDEGEEVGEQPVVEGDSFSVVNGDDTHADTRLRVEQNGEELANELAGEAVTSMAVPSGILEEGEKEHTLYLAYKGETWGWSREGSVTVVTVESFFPQMDGEQNDDSIGEPVSGGYAVSEREDILGEKYGLVVSGGDGDSWQREVDEDGNLGAGGDGQINWSKDELVIADHLDDAEDNHGGLDEGVCPNLSDLENRWGSDWQTYYPSSTDGLYNSEVALAVIKSRVENVTDSWEDHPAWNCLRQLREEELGGQSDWYWPAQATEDNFGGDGTLDEVSDPAESEMADIFWRLLQGYASDISEGGSPEEEIPERLYKFFYERPDDETQGAEAFDAYYYWSSSESGSDAFHLYFSSGYQGTTSKGSTYCVRACRRVYL